MKRIDARHGPSDELDEIVSLALPLTDAGDLDPLLERIADARFVLLGEASHGHLGVLPLASGAHPPPDHRARLQLRRR